MNAISDCKSTTTGSAHNEDDNCYDGAIGMGRDDIVKINSNTSFLGGLTLDQLRRRAARHQQKADILLRFEQLSRALFGSWGTCQFLIVVATAFVVWVGGVSMLSQMAPNHLIGATFVCSLWGIAALSGLGAKYVYMRIERRRLPSAHNLYTTVPADWVCDARARASQDAEQSRLFVRALEDSAALDHDTVQAASASEHPVVRRL